VALLLGVAFKRLCAWLFSSSSLASKIAGRLFEEEEEEEDMS
jgi:hypothetical protein